MEEARFHKQKFVDPHRHLSLKRKTVTMPVKVHLHDYYELELVLSGSAEQNLNGTVYSIGPGSVYFLTPIDFHAVTPTEPLELANLAFDDTLLSPTLQQLFMNRRDNFIFDGDHQVTQTLQTLLELLLHQSELDDEYALSCRRNLLELILFTLARAKKRQTGQEASDSQQVQQSLQYLFCHFRENITLEEVAAKSGYTPNYFSSLFHEVTGERFIDFLGKLRVNYGKMLLLSTNLSISQVAEKSGFGSASNFFRRFRMETGMAPTAFRGKNE